MAGSESRALPALRSRLLRGAVIPAHPLALNASRRLDERRQQALTRYYCDAGAGGLAVAVHTTQFAIRDPSVGLLEPVLSLARQTVAAWCPEPESRPVMIAGVMGRTEQAVPEAHLARRLGYDAVLLGLAAWKDAANGAILEHCRRIADILPLFGFYLQPAVGGRPLDRDFWRGFFDIEQVVAVKVAPFDRYRTMDVTLALAASGRRDVALYTGNDDAILADLLTPFPSWNGGEPLWFAGGLLGQWAVWTRTAVGLLRRCQELRSQEGAAAAIAARDLLAAGAELTDANAALFDPSHGFAGCIPGIHEVLRRQGLLEGRWCLDPHEDLSPGQMDEIDRVVRRYPHLQDDEFVRENLDRWLNNSQFPTPNSQTTPNA